MAKPDRQMALIAFMQAQNCSNYVGSWRHPASTPDFTAPEYYQRIARTPEDGRFDLAFFDDRLVMPDIYGADHGWKRYPVIQAQSTATKLFGAIPSLSINSLALVGEIGFDYVANFPRERGILDAAYTTEVNSAFSKAATVDGNLPLTTKGEATQFSGACTVAMIIDMPKALPYGIDMKPTISLQHDFVGTSPVCVNVFQENTAAASLEATFNYLQAWSLNAQYTNHFPVFDGGKYYGLVDRDFASAVVSYEF